MIFRPAILTDATGIKAIYNYCMLSPHYQMWPFQVMRCNP
jgi:hypothetical protein